MKGSGSIVLGFSGRIKSGKTTLSTRVAELLGWPYTSFGDYVRKVARSRNRPESREVLQEIGQEFVDTIPDEFCNSVLREVGWNGGSIVVDGIRHLEILSSLKKIVSPSIVKVVYVEVDESMRQERLSDRVADEHAVWEFEKHPTEQQVKMDLRKHADLIVDTGRELDQLASEVVAWIRAL